MPSSVGGIIRNQCRHVCRLSEALWTKVMRLPRRFGALLAGLRLAHPMGHSHSHLYVQGDSSLVTGWTNRGGKGP